MLWCANLMRNFLSVSVIFALLLAGRAISAPAGEGPALTFTNTAKASEELKGLKAPSSPRHEWQSSNLGNLVVQITAKPQLEPDDQKEYDLPGLIDLAERANPDTKIAWDNARQAAAAVGLAQSEYFPLLAVKASAFYAREPAALPSGSDTVFADAQDQKVEPVLSLEWLLLDFGRRGSAVNGAKYRLLAANLGFNEHHQALVFRVQNAFYELARIKGRIAVAQFSVNAAFKVKEAAEQRSKLGLATTPEVSQAEQQAAQAAFDLEETVARERDAQVALAETIGVTPTVPIRVIDFSKLAMPPNLEETVEQVINRSLEQRPDLLAQAAIVKQKDAAVSAARDAYYPTLSFLGEAGRAYERTELNVEGTQLPWGSTQQSAWAVGFQFNWNLFDGGARRRKLDLAKSDREAAKHTLENARDQAISQVFRFYTDSKLAARRLEVATTLLAASDKSYNQTLESYKNGLSSLVDLLTARIGLSQAEYTQLDTRAVLLESTAALAFASGDIGKERSGPNGARRNYQP
jgi:outer membrane protein